MVSNRYILAGLNLVLLILIGCKTSEVVSGSKEPATDRQLSDKEYREFQVAYMDGNREKILGNYQKAEALFQKALEIDPNSAATKFELAKLGMEKGELEKAIEYAKEAREADPDNPWYSEFLAQAYAEGGRLEEAIEVIRDILDEYPEKYDYYFNLASLLSARGRHDEALKIYDDLESQFGAVEEISMQRQMIYLDQGDSEKALEEVNNLIELNPDEVRYLGMKAEILEEQGKIEEARKLYEDILVMDPDNGLVLLALYEIDEGTGKKEEANAHLVGAFKSAELSIDVKVNILLNMLNRRDVDQDFLIKLSDELVDTHAKNAKSHAIRGDIFNNFQMPEKALESFEKAVEIDPNRPPIWQEIMILNSSLNRFEEMKSASEKALEYFPQQPIFYLFNGIALQQLGNHEEAIATLNAGKNLVIENNDLLGQFHSSLGDAYHALENHELSDKAYDKALKYSPSNVIVLNNYAYYLALRGQKLEKAEEMAKKANDLSPDQSSFQDTYAWVLFKRGNYQNALFWIQEAIKNSGSSDPEVLEHHGDILHALGRTKDAVAAWQMAIEAGGNASALTEKIEKNDKSEQ